MQFDLDRNIDGAALDVQSNISATLRKLPPQLPAPPSFQKLNPADSPILFIALVSKTLPLTKVDDYAEQVFAEQISQITGVAQVLVFGQQKFAVRVSVDPDKAAARGLTLDNVSNAVAAANSSTPVGALLGRRQNVTVDATGQMEHAAEYDNLVVAWRNGSPVRLKEIATVYDSVENKQIAAWNGPDRAIVLAVYRQSDANTVDVVDNVKSRIPYYQSQLPPSGAGAGAERPLGFDPPVDPGRAVHAFAFDRARRHGHLRISEVRRGDADPCARAAGFADRRLRVHVYFRLFDRQHFSARDHPLGRLRRRRRHRHAREHHSPHRGRA